MVDVGKRPLRSKKFVAFLLAEIADCAALVYSLQVDAHPVVQGIVASGLVINALVYVGGVVALERVVSAVVAARD